MSTPPKITPSDQSSSLLASTVPAPPLKASKVLASGYDTVAMDALTEKLGLTWRDTAYGPQIANAAGKDSFSLLSEYGVIELEGADSFTFLQGQITNDVLGLSDGSSCLAAFCSAKGRTLANFWVIRLSADKLYLLTARSLAAALARRLSMFVLRAKTKVLNLTSDFAVIGCFSGFVVPPEALLSIAFKDQRHLVLMPRSQFEIWFNSNANNLKQLTPSTFWRYADCLAGLPFIGSATSELFVPQMINFELIDGISFKKGCYPGQEIVARSHYLGKNKRRMLLGSVAQELTPGSDVFAQSDGEPIGQVVMSAMGSDERALVLFETNLQLASEASVLVCQDYPIELAHLPYDVYGKDLPK
jgi:tRNA-modifying protein YgfZ